VHFDIALELGAILVAALAGGLAGVRKNLDFFGVLVVAWAASLGGGILRDVMIGAIPPVGIARWDFVATALAGGVIIFFFHPGVERMRRAVIVLDAAALAFFVLVGTVKGFTYGMNPLAGIMAGVLTAVGGGVVRDLLVGEVPLVLADRQFYAIPAFAGAIATALFWTTGTLTIATQLLVVIGVFGFRILALKLRWSVPSAAPRPKI
jgi:uncharacterized membrane protein YeiH